MGFFCVCDFKMYRFLWSIGAMSAPAWGSQDHRGWDVGLKPAANVGIARILVLLSSYMVKQATAKIMQKLEGQL